MSVLFFFLLAADVDADYGENLKTNTTKQSPPGLLRINTNKDMCLII